MFMYIYVYICLKKEDCFAKQPLKNATQTSKSILKYFNVPNYKKDTKFSTKYWALKTKQLVKKKAPPRVLERC